MSGSDTGDVLPNGESLRRQWVRRRVTWCVACVAVVSAGILLLVLAQGSSGRSAMRGALLGSLALAVLVSTSEMAAPASFLRWRRWMTEGAPGAFQRAGNLFERKLTSGSPNGSREQLTLGRVRLIGLAVFVSGVLTTAFVWWALSGVGLT
jgi:hypothetical protein